MEQPTITFHPLHAALLAGQDQTLDVLVRITPPAATRHTTERPPLNLALVIDRSGSMSGDKIRMARRVALAVLDRLTDRDRISIVSFANDVTVDLPSMPAHQARHARKLIENIDASGGTALHAGWVDGGLQVAQFHTPGALNRVLLISDGEANVGLTDADHIAADVRNVAAKGISTSTFGIGDHYDEALMEAMANAGDGNAWYVEHAGLMEGIFDNELQGLTGTTGTRASLGIEPNPELRARLQEVLNDLEANDTGTLRLSNLVRGRPLEVIVRLHIPAHALPAPGTTAGVTRVRVAWDDPKTGRRHRLRAQLNLPVLPQEAHRALTVDTEVDAKIAALSVARRKAEAARALREGDRQRAYFNYNEARATVAAMPDAAAMAFETSELDQLGAALDDHDDAKARKIAASQSYNRRRSR